MLGFFLSQRRLHGRQKMQSATFPHVQLSLSVPLLPVLTALVWPITPRRSCCGSFRRSIAWCVWEGHLYTVSARETTGI